MDAGKCFVICAQGVIIYLPQLLRRSFQENRSCKIAAIAFYFETKINHDALPWFQNAISWHVMRNRRMLASSYNRIETNVVGAIFQPPNPNILSKTSFCPLISFQHSFDVDK